MVLCMHSRQDEVVVGVQYNGESVQGLDRNMLKRERPYADNVLPFHSSLVWTETFKTTLIAADQHMSEVQAHGLAPLADIVEVKQIIDAEAASTAWHPLMQAQMSWRSAQVSWQCTAECLI